MRAFLPTLHAFGLAGLLGGLAAGLYDAFSATTDTSDAAGFLRLLAGTAGANLLLGALLGVGCGFLAPSVPPPLQVLPLLDTLRRRLWPGPDGPLQERSFTAATVVTGGALFVALFALVSQIAYLALSRIQSATLLAIVLTVAATVVLTLVLAVGAPLRAAIARAMERIVRRFPRTALLFHPLTVAAGVLAVATSEFAGWRTREAETWDALDLRAPAALLVLLAVLLGGGAWLRRLLERQGETNARRVLTLTVGGPVVAAMLLTWGLGTEASLNALGTATGSSRLVLKVMRLPFDRDGDGFAAILGGGDCDDAEPGVHPGAVDVLANGIDEDCDGADLKVAPAPATERPEGVESSSSVEVGPQYNLVLITVDAVRADHLKHAGYPRETSPVMDRLAAESTVFTHAYSTSSKTPTAVPSLLTGRYPGELVRDAAHFTTYLPQNLFIAELLHGKGYQTSAYPSHYYFQAHYGLGQGFETWQPFMESARKMEKVPCAEPVVVAALKHLENVLTPDADRPFFLWVHLLDPHKNYIEHDGIERFEPMDEPMNRYDHEIRYVDTWVGKLLEALRVRSDWNRTVVVLTSDHGEAFGEHGYKYHGFGLHEHQLRVPLMFRMPDSEPRKVETPVSLVDLAPTLLELAHVRAPAGAELRGRSLVPGLRGKALTERPLYAETPQSEYNPERAAYIEMPWKLHYSAEGDLFQLYRLDTDPGEKRDLYRSEPEPALRMREAMKRFRAERITLRPPVGTGGAPADEVAPATPP